MPETADVGDGGSVFAPAFGEHKRPRIEAIHGAIKKHAPPRKRICLGGGRVSGRSRENLITGLISRADLVHQQTVLVNPGAEDHGRATQRHLPPSFRRPDTTVLDYSQTVTPVLQVVQFTSRGPVSLTAEQAVRRYSVIHAQTEAARARWDAETEEAAQRWADTISETPQAIVAGTAAAQPAATNAIVAPTTISVRDGLEVELAPTTISERDGLEVDVAPTSISEPDGLEVDVAPTTILPLTDAEVVIANAAVAQDVSSRPVLPSSSTQTGLSMLRAYAFEDTRSGYNDDDDFEYPLI